MGICNSCESTSVATTKLILQDGTLQEYSYPVKVSFVLQKHPTYFICNSDDMEFNDVVSAINDDELLQLGQLYFALPLRWLKRQMKAEEMAALAVKASTVLAKCGGGEKCGCRKRSLFILTEKQMIKASHLDRGSEVVVKRRRSSGVGGRRNGKFMAQLNAIPE
ncbi:hypothetical protein LIER_38072 [Lithospermum erythrorhizon]|uniref:Uncharacterized protein n=1 Tax=Lithospermum erythrorhizon TaxID=34254 RepID=A0AAV3PXH4_LITER